MKKCTDCGKIMENGKTLEVGSIVGVGYEFGDDTVEVCPHCESGLEDVELCEECGEYEVFDDNLCERCLMEKGE